MNLESTAQTIDAMAETMRSVATELEKLAAKTRATGDPVYASEAANIAANAIPNLRLDLLVTRTMRDLMRASGTFTR